MVVEKMSIIRYHFQFDIFHYLKQVYIKWYSNEIEEFRPTLLIGKYLNSMIEQNKKQVDVSEINYAE